MRWVHLRMCQTCGRHPIIRSVEPGEDWSWCHVDELMMRLAAE
jgi:hypothetical protein